MSSVLSDDERATAMTSLPDWQLVKGRDALCKTFKFKSFNQAFGWMTRAAMKAEKLDHHPEWCNVYNKVEVILTTHSAGGVTLLDVEMARFMDKTV